MLTWLFLQIFVFCGRWCNVTQLLKSARKPMNNFFQIFMSGEQLFKSDSEARIFCFPHLNPKPLVKIQLFKQSPALRFPAFYLLPNVLRFMYAICKSKEKGQEEVKEVGYLKIKLLDSYLF